MVSKVRVPLSYGIQLAVYLSVWIEKISAYLVLIQGIIWRSQSLLLAPGIYSLRCERARKSLKYKDRLSKKVGASSRVVADNLGLRGSFLLHGNDVATPASVALGNRFGQTITEPS